MSQTAAFLPPNTLANLRRADAQWSALRQGTSTVPTVVSTVVHPQHTPFTSPDSPAETEPQWDVVICGGTLGIVIGAALAQQGWRVALIERGPLRGREQEWNISRRELESLVRLNLLTEAELETAIATVYNPGRICFGDGPEVWVQDVLNIGVDPVVLLETLKQSFLASGGQLFEHTPFQQVVVHSNRAIVEAGDRQFSTRLVLDAMGHFSPLVQQARQGCKPDAVCLVVGTCAAGFPKNDTGDLIVSFTPVQQQCQYFWEAFPARDGRTTYLFTYVDAHPDRPSLESLFDDYLRLLPAYQSVELSQLELKRALFGFFPCYRQSPLKPQWDRILPVGDSSGSQSPLSFGGFGALIRHLERLSNGISQALQVDRCDRAALALLQPYQPNLSVTWLFQRTMSVGLKQPIAPEQINQMLATIFGDMAQLGDPVLKPFLQDVVQFPPLFRTLTKTAIAHPALVLSIIPQVGLPALLDWLRHYGALAGYAAIYPIAKAIQPMLKTLSPSQQYIYERWIDALRYGSGNDY
jgi:lycopene cyclase CruP